MRLGMNISPVISIIIPVYNAENTIRRTLDSLSCNQYNIEIICVNDGSKDDSKRIINERISKDNRIRQKKKKNGGAATARNTGINSAKGAYLMFCDADDEYDKDLLKYIIEDIDKANPDYIVFDRKTIFEKGPCFDWLKSNQRIIQDSFSWTEYLNHTLFERKHSYVVFNKVYKASIIHNYHIMFSEELKLSEDLYFNFVYLQYAKNMIEDGRAKYLQHKVASSFTARRRPDYYFENLKVLDILSQEYSDVKEQFDDFFNHHILHAAEHAINRVLLGRDAINLIEKYKIIYEILQDKKFAKAYENYAAKMNSYERKKLKLLHYRLIFLYYIRYIYLPRFKRKFFQNG